MTDASLAFVRTTMAERRDPPPVGAQVTFVYRELTRDGVPRFASYWRRREAF